MLSAGPQGRRLGEPRNRTVGVPQPRRQQVQEVSRGRNGDCSRSPACAPRQLPPEGENKAMSCGSRCQRSSRECDRAGTWLGFTCESPRESRSWPTVCRGVALPPWLSVHSATARIRSTRSRPRKRHCGNRIRRGPAAGFAVAVIAALSFVATGDGVATAANASVPALATSPANSSVAFGDLPRRHRCGARREHS